MHGNEEEGESQMDKPIAVARNREEE